MQYLDLLIEGLPYAFEKVYLVARMCKIDFDTEDAVSEFTIGVLVRGIGVDECFTMSRMN